MVESTPYMRFMAAFFSRLLSHLTSIIYGYGASKKSKQITKIRHIILAIWQFLVHV